LVVPHAPHAFDERIGRHDEGVVMQGRNRK
jgi:hypothetical protein